MAWLASCVQDSEPWRRSLNRKTGFIRGVPTNIPNFFVKKIMDSLAVKIESLQNSVDMLSGFLHVFFGFGATLAVGLLLVKLTLRGN